MSEDTPEKRTLKQIATAAARKIVDAIQGTEKSPDADKDPRRERLMTLVSEQVESAIEAARVADEGKAQLHSVRQQQQPWMLRREEEKERGIQKGHQQQ